MITIILTYRNRNLSIVKNCFESLLKQSNKNFKVVLIDYGSRDQFKNKIKNLAEKYDFIKLLRCNTEQELWCKSKAINIALKGIETPYCFVGDIDMMFHSEFVDELEKLSYKDITTYFQIGFLSEIESKKEKKFSDFEIAFKSNKEATGMTLYKTKLLKSINGYDEFYHGWGSEDTDVHVRLKNANHKVNFYTDKILMLHQWHKKQYRTVEDVTPFHSNLELVNSAYLDFVGKTKTVKANTVFEWGIYNQVDYDKLELIDESYNITNKLGVLSAFINGVLLVKKNLVLKLTIDVHEDYKSTKQKTKALLGKKTFVFNTMQAINDNLLECLIRNLRNQPYQFKFNRNEKCISLIIKL